MSWYLSIDGGGALGIGPAAYLALVEASGLIRPNAYAGTSVGALLVSLAAKGYCWEGIRDIFMYECPRIFAPAPLWWRWNPFRPKYDVRALQAAAKKYLGDTRMCDLNVPVFLTAFDFHRGRPKVFDQSDQTPVWYAVLCSTAAPTYFPIVDGRYGDGGLIANNPAMVGLAGCCEKLHWDLAQTWCLSLGTNGYAWVDPQVRNRSKLGWVPPLLETFLSGNEELATFQVASLLGKRCYRIEPTLRHDIVMDDVTRALGPYRDRWERMATVQATPIRQWIDQQQKDAM